MPWYTDSKAEPMEVAVRYQVTMKHKYEDNSDCKCYRNAKTLLRRNQISIIIASCTLSSSYFVTSYFYTKCKLSLCLEVISGTRKH